MATEREREASVSTLISGIVGDAQELVRKEIALARQEIREEISSAKDAGIKLAIAGYILFSSAQKRMQQIKPVPEKTVETMKENVEWIKDRTTSDRT